MNTLRRGAIKKRLSMMHSGSSSRWSKLKLLYLVPALAACLWVSAKAEVYTTYLNGKLATQEELEAIDPSTIEHVDVIHPQKKVFIETVSEPTDTGELLPEVRPEDAYIDIVKQMPQFHGGEAAMYQYISQHIRYPKIAIENDAEGTVNVEFFVEEDGSITNVKALEPSPMSGKSNIMVTAYRQENSNISALDKDEGNRALQDFSEELIRGMPPFEPGRQQGKTVRTKVTLSITYQLN